MRLGYLVGLGLAAVCGLGGGVGPPPPEEKTAKEGVVF
jgi:hypothetical protein